VTNRDSVTARTIEIVDYDTRWPGEFGGLGRELRAAIGGTAVRIDHIGSTAVPGLAAKDVIDVQITVARWDDEHMRPALEAAGLVWRDDIRRDHCPPAMSIAAEELEKRFAVRLYPRRSHVHVRIEGRFNQRYALLCRDYLRTHSDVAAAYGEVKKALARLFPDNIDAYYSVKDPAFDLFMAGAREWAAATEWVVGPSDA